MGFSQAVSTFTRLQREWQPTPTLPSDSRWALQMILGQVIEEGCTFDQGDFAYLHNLCKHTGWMDQGKSGGGRWERVHEKYYRLAVETGNESACLSWEAWQNRPPLLYDGKRMYEGRIFVWEGQKVRCSSIDMQSQKIIACPEEPGERRGNFPIKFCALRH